MNIYFIVHPSLISYKVASCTTFGWILKEIKRVLNYTFM